MGQENIIVDRDDGVGRITLNRPEVLNALSSDLFEEMDAAIGEFEEDSDIRAIVITASGDRAFSAGGDIHEMAQKADEGQPSADPRRAGYTWHLAVCTKPTIGAINGLAYGGGALLASSFDIRVGCERTSFKFLAASYGRVNSTWSLPMQVGWPMAKELLFTARVIDAKEAYRIGLLNHLVSSDQLIEKAIEVAKQIAANDPRMVQGMKALMIDDVGASWQQMYQNELEAQAGELRSATGVKEAFRDFLSKRGRG